MKIRKHMNNIHTLSLTAALACLALTGCGNVKDQLGLTHEAPDEFAVITRAPLEIPTSLALPPPRPGMARPQEKSPETRAKDAVFGEQYVNNTAATESSAEAALLSKAGQGQTDPNIRAVVDEEAAEEARSNKSVAQKLLKLGGQKTEPTANVVDAKAEAQRLQDNIKSGKPVTEGETPSIER